MKKFFLLIAFASIIGCQSSETKKVSIENTENAAPNSTTANTAASFQKTYEGSINNKYPIMMELNVQSGRVTGAYYYKKFVDDLHLKGTLDEAGKVLLEESPYEGPVTGRFEGQLTGAVISGTWRSADGKKQMPFSITETDKTFNANDNAADEMPTSGATEGSVLERLQGKWRSTDDSKSTIQFEGDYYKSFYENEAQENVKFWLTGGCAGSEEAEISGENERYFMVNDRCFYITSVGADILELSYLPRGNTLRYKRMK